MVTERSAVRARCLAKTPRQRRPARTSSSRTHLAGTDFDSASLEHPHRLATTGAHHFTYGRNLPFMVMTTRSPLGFSSLETSILKSIALMIPSPNFSCTTDFTEVP